MKIKEVAQCTGLTEKAIRFYEQKHLITPQTYELNGRTFREYTEENIRDLTHIAVLRRSFFTVEQIRTILCEKERTPDVFREYRNALCSEYAQMTPLVKRIQDVEEQNFRGIADVAGILLDPVSDEVRPVPRELRLSPSDETSVGDKEEAYRAFLRHQAMRDRRDDILSFGGKILRFAGAILGIIAAMYVLWFALDNFRIMREVNVTLVAVEWQEGKPETAIQRTISISGEIRDYLFRRDFGDLTMEVSGYSESSGNYKLPVLSVSGKYGSDKEWNCGIFDTAQREKDGETVLFDRLWTSDQAKIGVMYVCENTGPGSFTYNPDSEKSRLLAFGITDAEQAQVIYEYSRIEERKRHDERIEELYGKTK